MNTCIYVGLTVVSVSVKRRSLTWTLIKPGAEGGKMLREHAQASGLYCNPEVPALSVKTRSHWMIRTPNNARAVPRCAVIGYWSPSVTAAGGNRGLSVLPDCAL